jgi:hypothetical protein
MIEDKKWPIAHNLVLGFEWYLPVVRLANVITGPGRNGRFVEVICIIYFWFVRALEVGILHLPCAAPAFLAHKDPAA